MGIGATTTPPATGEAIAQLMDLTRQLLAEQRETNRLLRKELEPPSPWMTGDEAAAALGRPLTKSGEHLRCLKYFRERGYLTVHGSTRPYTYSRKQVMDLRKAIEQERAFMPSRFR